jgi:hypothetical protein
LAPGGGTGDGTGVGQKMGASERIVKSTKYDFGHRRVLRAGEMIFFFEILITKYMPGAFYVLRVSRERFEVLES